MLAAEQVRAADERYRRRVPRKKRELISLMRERWARLTTEYSSWEDHQRECAKFLAPRLGRFFAEDRNNGAKRNENILDNTGTRAVRILGAGLMAGASSPSRQWFDMQTADPVLNARYDVRVWLDEVVQIILNTFARSNIYRALQQVYEETGTFGTGALLLVPDSETVIHAKVLTAGQYRIASSPRGVVHTLYREFEMTVGQVVEEFGFSKCSERVQDAFDEGQLDEPVLVRHAIEPRTARDYRRIDNEHFAWRSVYWEVGQGEEIRDVLRESGFRRFPAMVPRWAVTPGDDYGNGPGMEALPDVISLQHEQFRKGQAIDYLTKPPLALPPDMKNAETSLDPGAENYTDSPEKVRPMWEVGLQLQPLLEDIHDVRGRINSSFFADLFLMLYQSDKNMTATEVVERHEEKLLMLGPVLERLHNELLEPLVDLTFDYLLEAGMIPPPPPELAGAALKVEFVSMLAQAQRAVGAKSVDRFVASLGAVAQFRPEVLDKLNVDAYADDLAHRLGVPTKLLEDDAKVAELRESRAQVQAQTMQAEQAQAQANVAKDMAQAASLAPAGTEMFSGV